MPEGDGERTSGPEARIHRVDVVLNKHLQDLTDLLSDVDSADAAKVEAAKAKLTSIKTAIDKFSATNKDIIESDPSFVAKKTKIDELVQSIEGKLTTPASVTETAAIDVEAPASAATAMPSAVESGQPPELTYDGLLAEMDTLTKKIRREAKRLRAEQELGEKPDIDSATAKLQTEWGVVAAKALTYLKQSPAPDESEIDGLSAAITTLTLCLKTEFSAPPTEPAKEAPKPPDFAADLSDIDKELSAYEAASSVATFNFAAPYNGQPIDKFLGDTEFKIGEVERQINGVKLPMADALKYRNNIKDLRARIEEAKRKVAADAIETWKKNLDTKDKDFGELRAALTSARAYITGVGSGIPTADPNPLIKRLELARQRVVEKAEGFDSSGRPNFSGLPLQYIRREYIESADTTLAELRQLKDRLIEHDKIEAWKLKIGPLLVAVDAIIDSSNASIIAAASYSRSETLLLVLETEKSRLLGYLNEDQQDSPGLAKVKTDLANRTTEAEKIARERINNAGLEELNRLVEVINLNTVIAAIRAINKSTQIHPHNPTGFTTADLETKEVDLEAKYAAAEPFIKDGSTAFGKSAKAVQEKKKLENDYAAAKEKLKECLVESKKEKSLSNPEKIARLKQQIEQAYKDLTSSDKPSKGDKAISFTVGVRKNITAFAQELDLLETSGNKHQKEWAIKLNMWDGFAVGANADSLSVQVAWRDSAASRKAAMGEISFAEMRDFMNMPGGKEAIDTLEDIFLNSPYVYETPLHTPLIDPAMDPTLPIEQRVVGVKRNRAGHPVDAADNPTTDINQMVKLTHNYAKNGQPQDSEKLQGKLTTIQLLKILHPTIPDSFISAAHFMAVIGELRPKAFIPYYAHYSESPKGTFDMEPIIQASPEAFLLYKIRSIGAIYDKYRIFWKTWSLPTGGVNVLSAKTGETELTQSPDLDLLSGFSQMPVKGSDNVRRAIHVREALNAYTTEANLGQVELDDSLQWIPTIWDVIRNGVNVGTNYDYDKTTFPQYVDGIKALGEFNVLVNSPPPLNSSGDLDTNLGLLVATFSPVKELHAIISPRSEYYQVWNQTIRQLMLRYLKDQYDKYILVSGLPTLGLKSNEFLRQVKNSFTKQASLPTDIQADLIDFVSLGTEGAGGVLKRIIKEKLIHRTPTVHTSLAANTWGNRQLSPLDARRLFSMVQGDVAAHTRFGNFKLPFNITTIIGKSFDPDVSQFTRDLKPTEKKQSTEADSKTV